MSKCRCNASNDGPELAMLVAGGEMKMTFSVFAKAVVASRTSRGVMQARRFIVAVWQHVVGLGTDLGS